MTHGINTINTTSNSINNFGNQHISILLNNNHPIQLPNVSSSTQQFNTCNQQFSDYLNYHHHHHHQSNIPLPPFSLQAQHTATVDYNTNSSDELNCFLENLDYTNNNHNSINVDSQHVFNNNQTTFKNEYSKFLNQNGGEHITYENQFYCNTGTTGNDVNTYQIQPHIEPSIRLPIQSILNNTDNNNNAQLNSLKLDGKLINNDFTIQQFQTNSVDILNKVLNNELPPLNLPNDNVFVGFHQSTNDIKNTNENDDQDSNEYVKKTDLDPKMKNRKKGSFIYTYYLVDFAFVFSFFI